ncbi:hypothetical protein SESBI_06080 [Sesbania bispinosa]|nr:hypothetical protein SESBI_06080 [Sesbania bispinosa]
MNIIRLGVLVFSSLPLLSCFKESIAQILAAATASQSHITTASEEDVLHNKKEDVSITANVAAQKHFQQIQLTC